MLLKGAPLLLPSPSFRCRVSLCCSKTHPHFSPPFFQASRLAMLLKGRQGVLSVPRAAEALDQLLQAVAKQLTAARFLLNRKQRGGPLAVVGAAAMVGSEAAVALAVALDTVVQCIYYHGQTCGWGAAPGGVAAASRGSGQGGTAAAGGGVAVAPRDSGQGGTATTVAAAVAAAGGVASLAAYSAAVTELHPGTSAAARAVMSIAAPTPADRLTLARIWDCDLDSSSPSAGASEPSEEPRPQGATNGGGTTVPLASAAAAVARASADPNPLLSILRSQWREGARLMGERAAGAAWAACRAKMLPAPARDLDLDLAAFGLPPQGQQHQGGVKGKKRRKQQQGSGSGSGAGGGDGCRPPPPCPPHVQAWRDALRTWPCHLYAYAAPNAVALGAMVEFSKKWVEIGAGTG